jgi:stage II sporulation protein D
MRTPALPAHDAPPAHTDTALPFASRLARWSIGPLAHPRPTALAQLAHVGVAFAFVVLLGLLPAGCASKTPGDAPLVRVQIVNDADKVTLTAAQAPMVQQAGYAPTPLQLPGEKADVVRVGDGWRIGAATLGGPEFTLIQAADGAVTVDGKKYRGRYRFVATGGNKFDVVNDVDVESYLKGVVAMEMLRDWQPEAYKAQAIAARTYALWEARTNRGPAHFDLYDSTRSQVYGGMSGESAKAVAAVDATRGLVLAYGERGKERIFKTYFSACCGGDGANVQDVFNEPAIAPLQGQIVGTLCGASPRFRWGPVTVPKAELTRRFRKFGQNRGNPIQNMADLDRIEIAAINQVGRPTRYEVTDARGNRFRLSSEEIRNALNTDDGPSTTAWSGAFKPVNMATAVQFTDGAGFGHGVGLCQWCCEIRARNGERYDKIVLAAYPKAVLIRAY